jgi:hypothetical protein
MVGPNDDIIVDEVWKNWFRIDERYLQIKSFKAAVSEFSSVLSNPANSFSSIAQRTQEGAEKPNGCNCLDAFSMS